MSGENMEYNLNEVQKKVANVVDHPWLVRNYRYIYVALGLIAITILITFGIR